MDNIELGNGSFVKCKPLTLEEFDVLRLGTKKEAINKFKLQFDIEVYKLDNSEVIVKDQGYSMLFYSIEDVEVVYLEVSNCPQGVEILAGKNPFGKGFPDHTKTLIKELSDALDIKNANLSEQLLTDMDERLRKLPNSSEFKKKHILHFIAVIGQLLSEKRNAKWKMILSSDEKTWNPYLESNGQQFQITADLYENIYNIANYDHLLIGIYRINN
ncbi:hypothetical protein [Pedobacter psychrodurus]|uniref:hypothetical protein n=1 Tax=Pedobacter psychrodurus TaxID=2530456 RepID=UPI002931C3FA|nr:hypothetical protein [Pedobacter psychrodurus]